MHIDSTFDGGNIEVVSIQDGTAELRIRNDNASAFLQWFCFRIGGARGRALTLRIVNAGDCTYPSAFQGYQAVVSHDGDDWRRTDTDFDGQVMTIRLTPQRDVACVAYFAPYPLARHQALIDRTLASPQVRHEVLGTTLDGRSLDLLTLGEAGSGRKVCWAIARQHPGETMAQWWMEGFLERLTDGEDPVSRALPRHAVLHIVPNMNPDGSARGHLRTNAAGVNLNREWLEPSLERSPEVFRVRERMAATGVDICIDVHGDEELPYNFLVGYEGIPDLDRAHQARFERFQATLAALTPDMQTVRGYPKNPPGTANLSLCTNYIAHTHKALAMTLEMPFKDTADTPDPIRGWSPGRARHLGRAFVDALYATLMR